MYYAVYTGISSKGISNITPHKHYPILSKHNDRLSIINEIFAIENDEGISIRCYQPNCAHLSGGTWTIIEKPNRIFDFA